MTQPTYLTHEPLPAYMARKLHDTSHPVFVQMVSQFVNEGDVQSLREVMRAGLIHENAKYPLRFAVLPLVGCGVSDLAQLAEDWLKAGRCREPRALSRHLYELCNTEKAERKIPMFHRTVSTLLEMGADPEMKVNTHGGRALGAAAQSENLGILQTLLAECYRLRPDSVPRARGEVDIIRFAGEVQAVHMDEYFAALDACVPASHPATRAAASEAFRHINAEADAGALRSPKRLAVFKLLERGWPHEKQIRMFWSAPLRMQSRPGELISRAEILGQLSQAKVVWEELACAVPGWIKRAGVDFNEPVEPLSAGKHTLRYPLAIAAATGTLALVRALHDAGARLCGDAAVIESLETVPGEIRAFLHAASARDALHAAAGPVQTGAPHR